MESLDLYKHAPIEQAIECVESLTFEDTTRKQGTNARQWILNKTIIRKLFQRWSKDIWIKYIFITKLRSTFLLTENHLRWPWAKFCVHFLYSTQNGISFRRIAKPLAHLCIGCRWKDDFEYTALWTLFGHLKRLRTL